VILRNEPILLTPGPLTTSPATRQAMLRDWGSWDARFNQLTASVCHDLVNLVNGGDDYVCVPLQGSGTFAVEAALGTLVPREGKVLVPNNGAYCARIVRILQILGRDYCELPLADDEPVSASALEAHLERDPAITHVAQVHLETSTGLLNPLDEIAAVCARRGVGLIVDAMSSLGALPIDARTTPFDALVSASGKCLEGVPGMGFVLVRKRVLEGATGRCHSLALDLHDQYVYMQKTTQWRYTPPTHVVAALRAALDQFLAEGGQAARGARYQRNCDSTGDRHVSCAGRPGLSVQAVLRSGARGRLYLVSGQADPGRDVPGGLHRRNRSPRDAASGRCDRYRAYAHGHFNAGRARVDQAMISSGPRASRLLRNFASGLRSLMT